MSINWLPLPWTYWSTWANLRYHASLFGCNYLSAVAIPGINPQLPQPAKTSKEKAHIHTNGSVGTWDNRMPTYMPANKRLSMAIRSKHLKVRHPKNWRVSNSATIISHLMTPRSPRNRQSLPLNHPRLVKLSPPHSTCPTDLQSSIFASCLVRGSLGLSS